MVCFHYSIAQRHNRIVNASPPSGIRLHQKRHIPPGTLCEIATRFVLSIDEDIKMY